MPNFCPSCGTKADEGYKFCLSCGAQLKSVDASSPENGPQKPNQQAPTTQHGNTPPDQKKSNKNLLITLVAILAIIIIIVVIIMFTGGGGIDGRFVGEWEISSGGVEMFYWIFNSDGSLTMTVAGFDMDIATWSVRGNQLCLNMMDNDLWGDFLPEGSEGEICYDFEFSGGENTVYLSIDGSENFVLTKT